MPIFDDITKKAAKITEKTIDKSQELAATAKTKLTIASKESDLKDLYVQLGEIYYSMLENEENLTENETDLVSSIKSLKEEIEELSERIK